MKAVAVFPGKHVAEVIDYAEPRIEAAMQVKMKILEIGVCGTDREIAAFEYGTPPDGEDHLVIGHEALAEVTEVGAGVTRVKVGDLVVPMVRRPCPHATCQACQAGRADFCYTDDFTERGIKQVHGFMTEYIMDDEQYLNVVPAHLRDVAVLTEPLTIAEKALAQIWEVQQRLPWGCPPLMSKVTDDAATNGRLNDEAHAANTSTNISTSIAAYCHKAVVLGAGPVGLLGAMMLVANGFETYVYSRAGSDDTRGGLIESFGAKFIKAETHTVEQMAQEVGGIDVVYEAVGASQLAFDVIKVLDTNAVFVFTGIPGRKGAVEIDIDAIMRNLVLKNQIVFGTVNAARSHYEAAISDIEKFEQQFPDAVRGLITGRFKIDEALPLLRQGSQGIKSVVAVN
ncbi:MAG: glucose 1-dehydrogenase [Pyrinomonadaceae bacterium MAG19_C2-C3]|nr:glucose 1-dehydrogenase [Pyrinomonadaceae bacterium MAG19_C2-C3]